MKSLWVLNRPPAWLGLADIKYAMERCGYDTSKTEFHDLRQEIGPEQACIVILPDTIFLRMQESVPGMPELPLQELHFGGFSTNGDNARYWDPHSGPFSERKPHALYRLENQPPPPLNVLMDAIAFCRQRPRIDGSAPPPPPPRDLAQEALSLSLRRVWERMLPGQGPWVWERPPPMLSHEDVKRALQEMGRNMNFTNVFDQRTGWGPHHDRIVVLPEWMPGDMMWNGFTDDHEYTRYRQANDRGHHSTTPYTPYRLSTLRPLPADVRAKALEKSQERLSYAHLASPPPPRWRAALNKLAELKKHFP